MPNSDFIKIYGFAKEWVKHKSKPFTSEDIKIAFLKLNPDLMCFRNYGRIMANLSADKLIIENDFVKAKCPAAKNRRIIQWISTAYSEQQSKNRTFTDEAQIKLL